MSTKQFQLTGGREGQTVVLGTDPAFSFTDGLMTLTAANREMPTLVVYLRRRWGAVEVTYEDSHATNVPSDPHPQARNPEAGEPGRPGEESNQTNLHGQGQPAGGDRLPQGVDARLVAAIKSLDVTVDTYWTAQGLPKIDAVSRAYGKGNLTRTEIEAACPGFTRATA